MGIISIGVGTAHMGRKQVDKDGNVVKETPARWNFMETGTRPGIWPGRWN